MEELMPLGRFALAFILSAFLFSHSLDAQGLFGLTAVGSTTTVQANSSSVINLVTDLTNNSAQFSPLANQTYNASLTYAGITNAVKINQAFDSSGNRLVTVRVPSTGLVQTFSGTNGSITDQIRNFLKTNGLAALTQFQTVVEQTSIAGVVDGNPMALTALLTDSGYQQFALHPVSFERTVPTGVGETRYSAQGGAIDAGGVSGDYVDLELSFDYQFNDSVGLAFTLPARWVSLRGSDIYMGGMVLGVPINLIQSRGSGSFSWQLTPAGHAGAVGSADFASGGVVFGGQIDSSFSYHLNGFTLTAADEAGYFHGADITVSGYDFDTRLDQFVFKNGLQISRSYGNFFIDASASWTNFLHNAFTDGYLSPELGMGLRFGKDRAGGVRIGYTGNFGDSYRTNGGNILLFFSH
jgi:hypothetical protein